MKSMISAIFVLFVSDLVISAKLPETFKICHRKDGNFQECLEKAVVDYFRHSTKPYPAIGLNQIDPYLIKEFTIKPGSQGTVNFEQKYKNVNVYGLSTINAQSIVMDFDKKQLKMHGIVPLVELKGDYDFKGKLLVLPIEGAGSFHYTIENFDLKCELTFEEIVKNNRKYYKVVDTKVHLAPGKLHMQLDNLFNGNKQLGDNINKVLNENSEAVFQDVIDGYENVFATITKTEAGSVFSRIPIDYIFPE